MDNKRYRSRRQERATIRDGDLQLEISEIPENDALENRNTLAKLLEYYHQKGNSLPKTPVNKAVKKADLSFKFMMKIRKELSHACHELLKII